MTRIQLAGLVLAAMTWAGSVQAAMTLSGIRSEVRRNVHDTSTVSTAVKYPDDILNTMANDAMEEVVNMTWPIERTVYYDLEAGTTFYDLPSDFIAVEQVVYMPLNGNTSEVRETTRKGLLADNPAWMKTGGSVPTEYLVVMSSTSDRTDMKLAVIPAPTSSTDGELAVTFYKQAYEMESDDEAPFDEKYNLLPYHQTIVYLVTAKIKTQEGKADEADFYLKLYAQGVATMKERLGMRPNYNPGMRGATR